MEILLAFTQDNAHDGAAYNHGWVWLSNRSGQTMDNYKNGFGGP